MAQMALVVFVLGAIVLRSLVAGLFVVTPLVAVMLANFGVMGWLGTAAGYQRGDFSGDGNRHRRGLRDLPAVSASVKSWRAAAAS